MNVLYDHVPVYVIAQPRNVRQSLVNLDILYAYFSRSVLNFLYL